MKTFLYPACLSIFLVLLVPGTRLYAQTPVNDDCSGAIHIDHPENFCSESTEFNNFWATPSITPWPACFPFGLDVWYSFVAPSSAMQLIVFSSTISGFGSPAIALYSGDCPNGLTELDCAFTQINPSGFQQIQTTGLTPGQTYFIRVASPSMGYFQICLKSTLLDDLSGDCPTATIICDKSEKAVAYVAGPGNDPFEWDDADCIVNLGIPGEYNTSWFVFTIATDGTVEFTITPDVISDDLDFLVYRLPNGPDDCSGKILERCELAGTFDPSSPCFGAVGLNASSTDISEPPNCFDGQDNFLRYLDVMEGETYALSVNNFTSTGAGFKLDWGGTATFEGPVLSLQSDDPDSVICRGEHLVLTDSIYYPNGTIDQWLWDFGSNASPAIDTTRGPHTIQYLEPGMKTINLTVRADLGCLVNKTLNIRVDSCCNLMAGVNLIPACLPDTTCFDAAAFGENGIAPFVFNWSNGQADSIATMLHDGDYSLMLQDAVGCQDTVSFTVKTNGDVNFPNAFTPNNDNSNDVFGPVGKNLLIREMKVWNRWGQLVYNSTGSGWDGTVDGKQAPSDVYVYRIRVRKSNGAEIEKSGEVTLLR